MIHVAGRRCRPLHYGTYDYSAALGIAAGYQSMDHPAADYAKSVMQVAVAGTGVRLSDGSTNMLPVGDPATSRRPGQLHARLVRRPLERGFYQGWDLHPAQLVTRYVATYAFFRDGLAGRGGPADELPGRHRRDGAGRAGHRPRAGPVPAAALDCGAVDEAEVASAGRSLRGAARIPWPTRQAALRPPRIHDHDLLLHEPRAACRRRPTC